VEQYKRVTEAHPNKIPVIVERAPSSQLPEIDRCKYLVPGDLTVAQFGNLIRKRIKLGNEQALIIYINGTLQAASAMFSSIYEEHKDQDGFLYVVYTGESSFGGN
jgi:GABA(A) receptor-associated protein